jgi:hypothetical protein
MKIYNELESLGLFEWLSKTHNLKDTDIAPEYLDELPLNDIHRTVVNATALRWFREKYVLEGVVQQSEDFTWYKWMINQYYEDGKKYVADWYEYKTYEEAELTCLMKLIEITKNKIN